MVDPDQARTGYSGTCYTCRKVKRLDVPDRDAILTRYDLACGWSKNHLLTEAMTRRRIPGRWPPCDGDEWEHNPAIELLPEKPCIGCGQLKPLAAFYRDRMAPDGRKDVCVICQRRDRLDKSDVM